MLIAVPTTLAALSPLLVVPKSDNETRTEAVKSSPMIPTLLPSPVIPFDLVTMINNRVEFL